jgi:AcrR family transcriptional regulator
MCNPDPGIPVIETPSSAGLRERKKQRTRDALVRAAVELFVRKGYERTTVDEIAAAVDVSQRTFFRYFANKEEVALALEETSEEQFVAAVTTRPAGEAPFEALRRALVDSWDHISVAIGEIVPITVHMRMYRLMESTPALLAAQMRRSAAMEERLAQVIARREGLDPSTDPRARVLVAAFVGVVRSARCEWSHGEETSVESLRRTVEEHLALLAPVLTQDWGHRTRNAGIPPSQK